MAAAPRILVIRGGALGDFILTLPALRLLRDNFPGTEIELLGYPRIAALADARFYADRVRSIDYGPLAGFFARNGTLDPGLCEYFAGFQQVVSYLYDPDGIFEANLRRAGVRHYLAAYRKPSEEHAAIEWARPLEALALFLEDPAAVVYPSPEDGRRAKEWLGEGSRKRLALHPGSGSPRKNWPARAWARMGECFLKRFPEGELVLVGGEADAEALAAMDSLADAGRVRRAVGLELPLLAAILAECGRFAGHDSGVSHLAAAAGARCVLLFGPTDPEVWAPRNAGVRVLRAPASNWGLLAESAVWAALVQMF